MPAPVSLPYLSSASYFQCIRSLGWGIWLDSGEPHSMRGRYDILSAAPRKTLCEIGGRYICSDGKAQRIYDDPWQAMQHEIEVQADSDPVPRELPFSGGTMGYWGYDLGRKLESLSDALPEDTNTPLLQLGVYDWAVVQDHQQQLSWFVSTPQLPAPTREMLLRRLQQAASAVSLSSDFSVGQFRPDTNHHDYLEMVERIRDYICAGDCYQVNFTQRFRAPFRGDALQAYLRMRPELPSPFSAYFEAGDTRILSLSPEEFLRARGGRVVTRPIKGTSARGTDSETDLRLAQSLRSSQKNRAENLMIVDLLRNDLSKVCESVTTPQLFALESYANVHHLVSTVQGTLAADASAIDLLRACFPGGSITGAPKIRAMQIIEELENTRRTVYCGSLGYIDRRGHMDTSIAIRTLLVSNGQIYCWGGGGIVYDSDPEEEYQESLTKIQVLLDTLSSG